MTSQALKNLFKFPIVQFQICLCDKRKINIHFLSPENLIFTAVATIDKMVIKNNDNFTTIFQGFLNFLCIKDQNSAEKGNVH